MTIRNDNGPLSLGPAKAGDSGSISTEFSDTAPHSLTEFYRAGGLVPDTGGNAAIPTTGTIKFTDFYNTASTSYSIDTSGSIYTYDQPATVTFNIAGGAGSETVYWKIDFNSSTNSSDFNTVQAPKPLIAGAGSFSVNILDNASEPPETFYMKLYSDSGYSTQIATTPLITITDWRVTGTPTSVNEGGTVNFTIAGGYPSANVYWQVINISTTNADFSGAINDGGTPISLLSTGTTSGTSFSVSINDDPDYEAAQTFQTKIYSDGAYSNLLATSNTITIAESDIPSESIAPSGNIFEYDQNGTPTITFNVAGANGQYWWKVIHGTTDSSDFTGTIDSTGTKSSFADTFNITIANNTPPDEQYQTFTVATYSDASHTNQLAVTNTIYITDYRVTTSNLTPSEGDTITFGILGGKPGATVYWKVLPDSPMTLADTSPDQGGPVTLDSSGNKTSAFTVTIVDDAIEEQAETFTVGLYSDSGYSNLLIESAVHTIQPSDTPVVLKNMSGTATDYTTPIDMIIGLDLINNSGNNYDTLRVGHIENGGTPVVDDFIKWFTGVAGTSTSDYSIKVEVDNTVTGFSMPVSSPYTPNYSPSSLLNTWYALNTNPSWLWVDDNSQTVHYWECIVTIKENSTGDIKATCVVDMSMVSI